MRVALPKGRLLNGVLSALQDAGLRFDFADDRCYTAPANEPDLSAKLIKARAVPQMVALGNFALGFCGLDIVREADYEQVTPLLDLGLMPVMLVAAVARGNEGFLANPPRRPILIATEYEHLADAWAQRHALAHITIQTWGSTEAYLPDDADVVFDCVETGRTMAANQLVIIEQIMASSTHLVANAAALEHPVDGPTIHRLVERLGTALARKSP